MTHPLNSKKSWQTERAQKLQRACLSIQSAIQRGLPSTRAIRRVSRRYHGKPYKLDPRRRIAMAPGTLRNQWDLWRRGGQVPAAFRLNYFSRVPAIPRPLLIRFVQFCASRRLPSLKAAWEKFSQQRGERSASKFSYYQVCYVFRAADFYALRRQLDLIHASQGRLDQIKFRVITDITNRLPLLPARRRSQRPLDFQI